MKALDLSHNDRGGLRADEPASSLDRENFVVCDEQWRHGNVYLVGIGRPFADWRAEQGGVHVHARADVQI